MSKICFKFLFLFLICFYPGLVYAHQPAPMQPPGNPSSVKFWDISEKKTQEEINKIFSNNMDKYRYFVQVAINLEDNTSNVSKNYEVSIDREINESDLNIFGKIRVLDSLDKSPKEREAVYKMRSFLATNYKTQVLPYEIYENEHLPRPFYLYELKDWVFGAVVKNDISFIRALLDNYNLLDIKNDDGYGILSYAVLKNRPDIVRFMIRRGANLNETNSNKETPLIIASRRNNLEIVQILARSGCNINHQDSFGHSSLDKAKINQNSKMHHYLSSLTKK